ncbi:hypothetical protein ENSA5_31120 [Enhygromyxa salina]|uniref:Uncharacterized protein n=1 Tax=Enhygromyxa salina TaxID=215803 RepID=A0A2S9XYF5_9BACT|nr:hypothetical protein ENSA5_31120 [Enhygromyxa salina]
MLTQSEVEDPCGDDLRGSGPVMFTAFVPPTAGEHELPVDSSHRVTLQDGRSRGLELEVLTLHRAGAEELRVRVPAECSGAISARLSSSLSRDSHGP